jgi:hypothetical protein
MTSADAIPAPISVVSIPTQPATGPVRAKDTGVRLTETNQSKSRAKSLMRSGVKIFGVGKRGVRRRARRR